MNGPLQSFARSKLLVALGLLIVSAAAHGQETSTAGSRGRIKEEPVGRLHLGNSRIAVEIEESTGALRAVHDKALDVRYDLHGSGFQLTADRGLVRFAARPAVQRTKDGVRFQFLGDDCEVGLNYRLGESDCFLEKWLEVRARDGKPLLLKQVMLEDARLGPQFREIHFHDDNTIWQCPINLFLRGEKGGCFAGIQYPWWDWQRDENRGFRLGYSPNCQVQAREVHVSEKLFLGVFRREGIVRYSQGPYPGAVPAPFLSWKGTGLSQHFKGGKIPSAAMRPEVLDWGEVWAMQEYMRHVLPDQPLPEDGYWVWQNGWWAGLFEPKVEILQRLKAAGVADIMTAHTWYGRGNHPNAEPYLSRMRIRPLGFPVDRAIAGMPGSAGPAAGLHAKHSDVLLDQFKPGEFTPDFRAPPAMEQFIGDGRKNGVHVSSFALPGIWFDAAPDWGSLDEKGKPSEYLFGRKVSCPGCDEQMDFLLQLHVHVFDKFQPRFWAWDGRWMSFWEYQFYRPGPKGVGADPCYAKNHGHPPGDNLYKEWKNILKFLAELRRRYPRMCLEQYGGLKRGGPWAMCDLNADDGYFETNGADMNRFETWHNQNDRFRPAYKNSATVFGEEPKDFQFNVITAIGTASYCQIGPGYRGLARKENQEFLKKWRAWAGEHIAYLKVKRDLFDCPGYSPVDGSAHVLGDRGFIFLFPGGFDIKAKPAKIARASVPLNHWLGLKDAPATIYQVTEVYPQEGKDLGSYRYGEDLLYDMPHNTAVILAVQPAKPDKPPRRPELGYSSDQVIVVKAWK